MTARTMCVAAALTALYLTDAPPTAAETWKLSAGGSWNASGNWEPASEPNSIGANATFIGAASGAVPAQSGNRAVTLDASKIVGSILFNNDIVSSFTTQISTGTPGSTLTFDAAGAGPATITANSVTGATGLTTIAAAMNLTDSVLAQINNVTSGSGAGAVTLTGMMTGPGGFTKSGDGMLTIATGGTGGATKNYTGPTLVNGGRLRISAAGQPTGTSSFTVASGGQLFFLTAGGSFTFGGSPSVPLYLNGNGPTTGPFAAFPGAIRPERATVSTIHNETFLESDTVIHIQATNGTGSLPDPTGSLTFTNVIAGNGKLTFTAANSDIDQGSLVLNGANTYSGGTLLAGGIIRLSGNNATLGVGDVVIDNASSPASIARMIIESNVSDAINDLATLSIAGGGAPGVADANYLDISIDETVAELILGGTPQGPGTYSSATHPEYFVGSGSIIVPGADADFDNDGDVDGADFLTWQRNVEVNAGATNAQGDADGNGAVNGADLDIWKQDFGPAATAAAGAIPEPSAVLMALLAAPLALLARRKR